MGSKPSRWKCLECGVEQDSPNKPLALADFEAHWLRYHQSVPWMEDAE